MMFLRAFGAAQRTDMLAHAAHLIDAGKIKSTINPALTTSWENIVDAHKQSEAGKTIGKLVLRVEQAQ